MRIGVETTSIGGTDETTKGSIMNRSQITARHEADPDLYAPYILTEGTAVWVTDASGNPVVGHIIFDTDFDIHAQWGHYTVAIPNDSQQGYFDGTYSREDMIPAGFAG